MGLSMADGTPTALTPPGAGHQAQGRDEGRAANDDSGITLARPSEFRVSRAGNGCRGCCTLAVTCHDPGVKPTEIDCQTAASLPACA